MRMPLTFLSVFKLAVYSKTGHNLAESIPSLPGVYGTWNERWETILNPCDFVQDPRERVSTVGVSRLIGNTS